MTKRPAVCATGHRPPGLPGGYSGSPVLDEAIRNIVAQMATNGYTTFISGGAIGVDQIFAKAVLFHKEAFDLELIVARPFPSQASKWPRKSQEELSYICQYADLVVDVNKDPYSPWKMQQRNKWMVDHSNLVFAVWNGKESGGTWHCIQYAKTLNIPIYHLNPFTMETAVMKT